MYGTRPISNAANGEEQILLLDGVESTPRNVRDIVPEELADTIPDVGPFFPSVFAFDLSPGTRQQFAVLSEIQDKIFWFAAFDPLNPKGYTLDSVIDIQAPCYVEGKTNSGQDIAWVGQRNAGLSVVRLLADRPLGANHEGFDAQIVSTVGAGRSLCFVYPTRLASTTAASPRISQLDDVIAVDFDQKELVLLADYVAPAEEYELVGTIPIDTDGLTTMDIIDVLAVGAPGSVPSVIWILMSDGLQNGEHRLVMVWQDTDDNILQKVHKFDGAVPSAMHQLRFFPSIPGQLIDAGADIVIVSSTSSEITIFEDDYINVNPTGNFIPIYKAPIYFDVGEIPASSSIIRLPFLNGAHQVNHGLVLSFRGKRDLRVFTYMD